jgi:hypothetical protein
VSLHASCYENLMMVWFFAEKQSSNFIVFFNSICPEQSFIFLPVIFDTRDHLDSTTASFADRNTYMEYPFLGLCSCHGRPAFGQVFLLPFICSSRRIALAPYYRRHQGTVPTIRREHTMGPRQIDSGPGHQGGKPCHEIQWLEDDVGSAISIPCLQRVADVAV